MKNKIANVLWIGIALAIIGIGVISILPVHLSGNAAQVRPEFERRRAQWEAAGIEHYQALIWMRGGHMLCRPARVEVQDNQVLDYEAIVGEQIAADCEFGWEASPDQMTIEHIFDVVAYYLDEERSYSVQFRLVYDQEYGFPVEANLTSTTISHMPIYSVSEFEVLP